MLRSGTHRDIEVKGMKIDWKDGHHSEYSLAYLRDQCPCATCTGAHGTDAAEVELFGPGGALSHVQARAQDAGG